MKAVYTVAYLTHWRSGNGSYQPLTTQQWTSTRGNRAWDNQGNMAAPEKFSVKFAQALGGLFLSFLLGIAGGGICGAVILSFGDLIGRSGNTGEEYVGSWSPATLGLGLIYGGFFGAFVGLLAYPFFVRSIGFRKALLPAVIGTLLGGFAGALAAPPSALLVGILGFFAALGWKRYTLATKDIENSVGR